MATMTISEAELIYYIAHAAAGAQDTSHGRCPVSALEGHDIYQVFIAIKLVIAGDFLLFSGREDFEKQFTDGLEHAEKWPWVISKLFVPDDQIDSVFPETERAFWNNAMTVCKDERMTSQETAKSFGEFCKCVGSKDPLYWQKIYTRLGLEYTSSSPKRNDPVFSKILGPTVGLVFETRLREIRDRLPPGPS